METTLVVLRFVHIAAGMLALGAGAVPLASRKGNPSHRRWGKIYMGAMGVVLLTALLLSLFKSIPFLLLISVFSTYLLLSGYRSLHTKDPSRPVGLFDIALVGSALTGGVGLAGYSAYTAVQGSTFGIAGMVFGGIGILLALADIRRLRSRTKRSPLWLYAHISRMTGAYISTVTAFLVVNVQFLPGWLLWLLPTVVGTLAITRWRAHYGKKPDLLESQYKTDTP